MVYHTLPNKDKMAPANIFFHHTTLIFTLLVPDCHRISKMEM